jgi:hypothetical protein
MGSRQFKIAALSFAGVVVFAWASLAQETQNEQHIEVALRMIGHQVLLNFNDSSSRVLPIVKEKDRYRIQLESEFEFNPEELVATIERVMKDTKLANAYIVEVEQCGSGEIVYSYEINDLEKESIVPCQTRAQPKSCYNLLFTLMDKKGNDAAVQPTNSTTASGLFALAAQAKYILITLLIALLAAVLFLRRKRAPKPETEVNPNLIPIGEYYFDKRTTELLFGQQKTELSSKEADLLLLLYNAANTTIEREVILNKVWGDDGDYVGRTLDVFISKLRKKLEADASIKIVNIRGIGYKLVLDV